MRDETKQKLEEIELQIKQLRSQQEELLHEEGYDVHRTSDVQDYHCDLIFGVNTLTSDIHDLYIDCYKKNTPVNPLQPPPVPKPHDINTLYILCNTGSLGQIQDFAKRFENKERAMLKNVIKQRITWECKTKQLPDYVQIKELQELFGIQDKELPVVKAIAPFYN